ncbi:thiol-disulfide oxidoreductase DCC family protein [Metabacillus iocasae]|uniref:DCC family thiol-disulfide oxidoreductase YuxK n=1 Tax=Priestia iocasae TaxID=2291674 RepID=A0ABS2QRE0_9BACI|nr:thiol-disulfide oxidoreductase DCC family protein [Metabacillus iocasae]MBM7702009.1 putative DCC family thiol-disulfide oxidoreductase YuxK [Metabacillus iocasae]
MTKQIILFDGVCNLCEHSVQFIIKHDPRALFSFASLQSDIGQRLLKERGLSPDNIQSVVYVTDKKVYTSSTAALKIAYHLDGGWKWLYYLIVIPKPIRDLFYSFIAKNRYKWFGKTESCLLPNPENKKRFLE